MPEGDLHRVVCPSCGKPYRWKDEFSRRKVKCKKCANVFRMPVDPTGTSELIGAVRAAAGQSLKNQASGSGGEYELSISEEKVGSSRKVARCPSCGGEIKPNAVICINCGFNLKTNQKTKTSLGAQAMSGAAVAASTTIFTSLGRSAASDTMEVRAGQTKTNLADRYLPVGLIVLGILFSYGQNVYSRGGSAASGTAVASISVLATILAYVPLALIGLYIASKMANLEYGPFGTAVLKFTAIAFGGGSLGGVIGQLAVELELVDDAAGQAFGVLVSTVVYWGLVAYLFGFDMFKTIITVFMLAAVKFIAIFLAGSVVAAIAILVAMF